MDTNFNEYDCFEESKYTHKVVLPTLSVYVPYTDSFIIKKWARKWGTQFIYQ